MSVIVVCCQAEVSTTGRSLVQRSLVECGVSECYREVSVMRRRWPTRGCSDFGRKAKQSSVIDFISVARTRKKKK